MTNALLRQYVSLKTGGENIPSSLQIFEMWFSFVYKEWKKEAKNLEDLITLGGRHSNFFPEVSPEEYKRAINLLSIWQTMTRREEIDGLLTEQEKRDKKLQEIQKSFSSLPQTELQHLREEAETLGDQREDIVSHGTFQLVDLKPEFKRKRTP